MVCSCAQERIFVGLDYGATHSGAHALKVLYCDTHGCFQVLKESRVPKFPTRFIPSTGTSLRLMGPEEEGDPDHSLVRYTKLELMMLHEDWFKETSDCEEIKKWIQAAWKKSGVQVFGAECLGVAVNRLFDLALAGLGEEAFPKESISILLTFPYLSKDSIPALKRGIDYVALASKCSGVRVVLESFAALIGVLQQAPRLAAPYEGGEGIIVADCGGLTLDMGVFSWAAPCADSKSSVLGGGVWLDRNFERLIDRKIDEALSSRRNLQRGDVDYYKSSMIDQWHEDIKKQNSLPSMGTSFDFPFFDTQISVNRNDLEGIIMNECKKISDAIGNLRDEELGKSGARIKRVFITGGLGCSRIIRDLVQRMLDHSHEANPHKERLVLEFGHDDDDDDSLWNAVSRGAAYYCDTSIPVNRANSFWDVSMQQL